MAKKKNLIITIDLESIRKRHSEVAQAAASSRPVVYISKKSYNRKKIKQIDIRFNDTGE